MPELIAIAYTDETLAGEAAVELDRCAADGGTSLTCPLGADLTADLWAAVNGEHVSF
jgi:hypothetical protein